MEKAKRVAACSCFALSLACLCINAILSDLLMSGTVFSVMIIALDISAILLILKSKSVATVMFLGIGVNVVLYGCSFYNFMLNMSQAPEALAVLTTRSCVAQALVLLCLIALTVTLIVTKKTGNYVPALIMLSVSFFAGCLHLVLSGISAFMISLLLQYVAAIFVCASKLKREEISAANPQAVDDGFFEQPDEPLVI